jgi:hypothetical protein
LEILEKGGVGRAYAKVIEHASGEEVKPFFDNHISPQGVLSLMSGEATCP